MIHSSDLKKYWYVAAFQDMEAGATLSALAGCEGTPPLSMPKFKRTIIQAMDAEQAYDMGHSWVEENFADEIFMNDYAFLADDYDQKHQED
jgi:hypothetical protein